MKLVLCVGMASIASPITCLHKTRIGEAVWHLTETQRTKDSKTKSTSSTSLMQMELVGMQVVRQF